MREEEGDSLDKKNSLCSLSVCLAYPALLGEREPNRDDQAMRHCLIRKEHPDVPIVDKSPSFVRGID